LKRQNISGEGPKKSLTYVGKKPANRKGNRKRERIPSSPQKPERKTRHIQSASKKAKREETATKSK